VGDAFFSFLLHTHMPYVRRNGDWPCGEEWILEAWAESYIPLWKTVEDLTSANIPGKLALTLTPVLAEQLQDAYLQERMADYLQNKVRLAGEEISRLEGMGDEPRANLARHFRDRYISLHRDFQDRLRGRMMDILRAGMESGRVEVLASAATHAHLPLLGNDTCRRAQIAVGIESYRRCFGHDPEGFWLPECAYAPELDALLDEFSPPLKYVILDFSAPQNAPQEALSWEARSLGSTSLLAFMRDQLADSLVWTWDGIPSHSHYREYNKRDWQGHGYQYWRVTSLDTPLDEKDIYHPEAAAAQAEEDAREFADALRQRKMEILSVAGKQDIPRVILAAYDTELLGHWWLEGPIWLREVLRRLSDDIELPSRLARKALLMELPRLSPELTTWIYEGDFSAWLNPHTADIWEKVHRAEKDLPTLKGKGSRDGANPESLRALAQAARELLLMEASDWTFMITREKASAYGRDRFVSHFERYNSLLEMLGREAIDLDYLSSVEDTDNLFAWLIPGFWE
jgi:1,4-alpha-glucan branching enzyme